MSRVSAVRAKYLAENLDDFRYNLHRDVILCKPRPTATYCGNPQTLKQLLAVLGRIDTIKSSSGYQATLPVPVSEGISFWKSRFVIPDGPRRLSAELKRQYQDRLAAAVVRYRRWQSLGNRGERVAAKFLRTRKRLYIVERSARNLFGEIDLIAVDRSKTKVIFVEVKTRKSHDRGHPVEAVSDDKQRRITRIALAYMKHNQLFETCSARFDVVAVTWPNAQRKPDIVHYESAFDAVGRFQMFS